MKVKLLSILLTFLASCGLLAAQTYQAQILPYSSISNTNDRFPLSDGNAAWLDWPYFLNIVGPEGSTSYVYQCNDITSYSFAWNAAPPSRLNPASVPFSEAATCLFGADTITLNASGTGKWTTDTAGQEWSIPIRAAR